MLSKNKYLEVIKETTLTSVDLILINDNKILGRYQNKSGIYYEFTMVRDSILDNSEIHSGKNHVLGNAH